VAQATGRFRNLLEKIRNDPQRALALIASPVLLPFLECTTEMFVQHLLRGKTFAPLAQLAEQVTLNFGFLEARDPALPNTLPICVNI